MTQEFLAVTGMILKTVPVGEYDRRVVILTTEMGKISAFAKSARKPNSHLVAATNPFSFGKFRLYAGRNSYNIIEAEISNYFEELREDFVSAYYGMYFLEISDYYTRENNDEKEQLRLLYQSIRAICLPKLNNKLIRSIFEIKSIVVNGEFPGIPENRVLLESTIYTIRYIVDSGVEKLYTFDVSSEVLHELISISEYYRKTIMDHKFMSLEILDNME
ncbi:MAG: DNA repair protein RecO [Lachnospiraceae bacterium]|nr:DNA repair protein RecO [Lachnospiraceae bacterium]